MATYAVGDLQGCLAEFEQLLEVMSFGQEDQLWLVGDLVNRGPRSKEMLETIISMDRQVVTVLGNHDLHFLAIHDGGHKPSRSDTFDEMLASPRVDEYTNWLRRQKLAHSDRSLGFTMTHAGIPHIWTVEEALAFASEVEAVLRGDGVVSYREYCETLYGNEPALWDDDLEGMARIRLITNYLTRMRLIGDRGLLDFSHKGALADAPSGWSPWFELNPKRAETLVFGHWAALDGDTGLSNTIAIDTGCVWGRKMTGICLETREIYSVPAAQGYS
ncbi:MAG: symmetrical bis(5'-nucleosyl)-tetraphosphatase [Pseudomonadales bacterium]|nr:symmetrical bis(5'-nucleosyl)-tetraphosphatase [Pseudomonadales bacterium]